VAGTEMTNMLDSMARGSEGKTLTEFAKRNGLSVDNLEDWCQDTIDGIMSGRTLGNINGGVVYDHTGKLNDEYLLHLIGKRARCVVNVSVILAMAVAYCLERQRQAVLLLENKSKRGAAKKALPKKKTISTRKTRHKTTKK